MHKKSSASASIITCCLAAAMFKASVFANPASWILCFNSMTKLLLAYEVNNGDELHRRVPSSKWCVTREDFVRLRCEVEGAIVDGRIAPTAEDCFDREDRNFGPNMFTVNKQYIKPVTANAGNASWALMLHPDGLECDLFITHCWAEGFFEFIDKVLNSWPWGARHAYCCILSNPQNLDVGALVRIPRDSPFAHALWSARWVLVVPNRSVGIYTRIWCVYEAFLGCLWQKEIFTAHAPLPSLKKNLLPTVMSYIIAFAVMFSFYELLQVSEYGRLTLALLLMVETSSMVLAVSADTPSLVQFACYFGMMCNGFGTGSLLRSWISPTSVFSIHDIFEGSWRRKAWNVIHLVFCFADCFVFVMARIDSVRRAQQRAEAGCLLIDYSGHVMDAHCTVQADGDSIRREIKSFREEEHVDEAVKVLIQAGMSTPDLQQAAKEGVDMTGATHSKHSQLVACWIHWLLYNVSSLVGSSFLGHCNATKTNFWLSSSTAGWISCSGLLQAVFFVAMLSKLPRDRVHFAADAMCKFVWCGCVLPWVMGYNTFNFFTFAFPSEELTEVKRFLWSARPYFLFCCSSMTLIVSILGPGRFVHVPCIGKALTQLVFAKTLPQCCATIFPRRASSHVALHQGIELQSRRASM